MMQLVSSAPKSSNRSSKFRLSALSALKKSAKLSLNVRRVVPHNATTVSTTIANATMLRKRKNSETNLSAGTGIVLWWDRVGEIGWLKASYTSINAIGPNSGAAMRMNKNEAPHNIDNNRSSITSDVFIFKLL